jgi:hypothetical protein
MLGQSARNILIGQYFETNQDLTQSAAPVLLMAQRLDQLSVAQQSL